MVKLSLFAAAGFGIVLAASAAQAADVANGEKLFKQRCGACHSVQDGQNKVGPSLYQVVGREKNIGGYAYSKLNEAAHHAGLAWTEENLTTYLADPQAFLEKFLKDAGKADEISGRTKMAFKLPREGDRQDVVAYLKSLQ